MSVRSLFRAALAVMFVCFAFSALAEDPPANQNATPAPAQQSEAGAAPQTPPASAPGDPAAQPTAPPNKLAPVGALPQRKAGAAPTTRKSAKTGRTVILVTNDELERLYGPSEPPPESAPGAETGSAAAPEAGGAGGAAAAPGGEDPAARMQAIQDEMARLQKHVDHLRNPFRPPASMTPGEREALKGQNANQQIQQAQQRISELSSQLQTIKDKQQPADGSRSEGQ